MKIPQYIFIHHTAVSYDKNPDQWPATDAYHKSKGWGGGGYNYEVSKAGSIHQFREDGSETAAQYQNNMNDGRALSICLDGNFDIELPTVEQKKTLKDWLNLKMTQYNIPPKNVFCHRKVATYKTCPGKKLPDDIFHYFLSALSMPDATTPGSSSNPPIPLQPWAKDACLWALQAGIISDPSHLDENKQWTLVILHRFWKKFKSP